MVFNARDLPKKVPQKRFSGGLVMSAAAIAGRMGTAQSATTRVVIDTDRQIAPVSHELFGSFLERSVITQAVPQPQASMGGAHGVPGAGQRQRAARRRLGRRFT